MSLGVKGSYIKESCRRKEVIGLPGLIKENNSRTIQDRTLMTHSWKKLSGLIQDRPSRTHWVKDLSIGHIKEKTSSNHSRKDIQQKTQDWYRKGLSRLTQAKMLRTPIGQYSVMWKEVCKERKFLSWSRLFTRALRFSSCLDRSNMYCLHNFLLRLPFYWFWQNFARTKAETSFRRSN